MFLEERSFESFQDPVKDRAALLTRDFGLQQIGRMSRL